MHDQQRARQTFLWLWTVVTAIKILIAARLPLFVDEAFYWQEGQHLAAAYSDLPGLTAWLTRLGTEIGGPHVLALRAPFLLIAALLPWLVAHIGARWFDDEAGWRAGSLTVLMPLAGSLGLLALPDVPMALATVVCIDAGGRLLRKVDAASAAELGLGLAIGALSHYRFVGVIGVGFLALLLLPPGRLVLRDPRVWVALALGAAAWAPLVAWNLEHAESGLRFQLVDRHPWSFQGEGAWFLLIQALLVTPLLFVALVGVFLRAFRGSGEMPVQWRYFGLLGGISTVGFFALGFFADVDRVSFHWPLPGYLALVIAVPVLLRSWPRDWRIATWWLAGAGLAIILAYYMVLSMPSLRAKMAAEKFYPSNFAGWNELGSAVREELAQMPESTEVLAGNFKTGAELGFALGDPRIAVLDHPLNHKHGRAPQLQLWGLQSDGSRDGPLLLVVTPSEVRYRSLLEHYHGLCRMLGPLPTPRVVSVDHGRQRFLLFALPPKPVEGPCQAPAMAWIDSPVEKEGVGPNFEISGWAFKDGVGLERVEVLVDGKVVAQAQYGLPSPGTADYWKISTDPNHPDVGFTASVDAGSIAAGRHWLGLRLHALDGSVEDWPEQAIEIRR